MKYMEQHILEVTEHFVSPEERTRLLRFCMKMVGDKDVAEDLVQETLLEAWKHLHNLRDVSRRTQWLSGVARNVCLRWLRKSSRDTTHLIDPLPGQHTPSIELEEQLTDDFDIEVELERKELIELLDRAMALLPPETRAVLVKRYVEDSPLQEVAAELGMNVSAVAMRLQRGKLALRRVLITDLREEIAPYAPQSIESMQGQWEETPFWCFLCGQHRLLGIRDPEKGKLLLKCPGCNGGAGEVQSYNDLPLLKGVKGYKPMFTRLRNWCSQYYWTGLRDGSVLCEGCGRMLPVRISGIENLPNWVQSIDDGTEWTRRYMGRFVTILCETCRGSFTTTLESLVLELPEGRQFLQTHSRIRTLPSQEVEAEGRRTVVTRHESVTDNATLTAVADYETYRVLRVDRSDR
ncbi:MAG: RNA polymerase sigma factor [Ktedonobacteraceae bacterium]